MLHKLALPHRVSVTTKACSGIVITVRRSSGSVNGAAMRSAIDERSAGVPSLVPLTTTRGSVSSPPRVRPAHVELLEQVPAEHFSYLTLAQTLVWPDRPLTPRISFQYSSVSVRAPPRVG